MGWGSSMVVKSSGSNARSVKPGRVRGGRSLVGKDRESEGSDGCLQLPKVLELGTCPTSSPSSAIPGG